MSNIILPFTTDVEAKAYQYSAHALGAIKANLTNSHLWAAGKFLSLYFESNNQLHMYDADMWSINEGVTTQQHIDITPSSNTAFRSELLELVKGKIQAGNYIVGMYDEYFIPKKSAYLKYHFLHDYLIFGFNDAQKVFKSAGYLASHKYEAYDIPYNAYIDSITLCDCHKIPLYFRYVHYQYTPKLQIASIYSHLESFLLSHDDLPRQPGGRKKAFGISGLECFQQYVTNYNQEIIDLRNSRSYMEYFQYMHSRLHALVCNGNLEKSTLMKDYYHNIVKPAKAVHNLCIKYNLCGDRDSLLRAGRLVDAINQREVENTKLLLDQLYVPPQS